MMVRSVFDVAAWRLCTGCGACEYGCADKKVRLVDFIDDGIRPVQSAQCGECGECLKFCPGYDTSHQEVLSGEAYPELKDICGPVLELWEGYAAEPDIRLRASSGGVASALALYCMESEGMAGTLHAGASEKEPCRNRTFFSTDRNSLIRRAGSRYAPASPCDGLENIEKAPSPCVFIGKPCDVAGLRKAQKLRRALNEKTGLAISIFCAGTPSTRGTVELLRKSGVKPEGLEEVRYRGNGWPGDFTARVTGEEKPAVKISYRESWSFLQKYRPFRCYLCPDGTGEFADISCGDPWHRENKDGGDGRTLVIVRTERGKRLLAGAARKGYLRLEKAAPNALLASQENLFAKRKEIWGRLLALRLSLLPTPKLAGFALYKNWAANPLKEKCRSVLGTIRRIAARRYFLKKDLQASFFKHNNQIEGPNEDRKAF